jgi:20S proteasome subunit beta 1
LTFVLDREIDSYVVPSVRRYHNTNQDTKQNKLVEAPDQTHNEVVESNEKDPSMKDKTNFSLSRLPQPEASTCVICRSGSAADTQHLASIIRSDLVSRQILYRIRGTVTHVAALLWNLLSNDSSLSASLICAGYDHELRRGVIYSIAPGGTVFEERMWAAGGSGSTYVLGYLDSHLSGSSVDNSDKLIDSEEKALDLVYNALCLAMDRDGSSGGFVRMYVIDQSGRRFVSRMPNGEKRERVHDFDATTTSSS